MSSRRRFRTATNDLGQIWFSYPNTSDFEECQKLARWRIVGGLADGGSGELTVKRWSSAVGLPGECQTIAC